MKFKLAFIITIIAYLFLILNVVIAYNLSFSILVKIGMYIVGFLGFILLLKFRESLVIKESNMIFNQKWDNNSYEKNDSQLKIRVIMDDHNSFYKEESFSRIDKQSWFDLNLDDLYKSINNNITLPGDIQLYDYLIRQPIQGEVLKSRDKLINLLTNNKNVRNYIINLLNKIGKADSNTSVPILCEAPSISRLFKILCPLFFVLNITSVFIMFFGVMKLGFFLFLFTIIINASLHYYLSSRFAVNLIGLVYLKRLYSVIQKSMNSHPKELSFYLKQYEKDITSCRSFVFKTKFLLTSFNIPEFLSLLVDYINTVLLIQENMLIFAEKEIQNNNLHLKKVFMMVGEIDALLSVALFKKKLKKTTTPSLREKSKNLKFDNIKHPLLDSPIANSLKIEGKGLVITGSNMSGKSTFIRTLGVNVILAQAFNFVYADTFESGFFRIATSVGTSDNLLTGKSFYFVEAERILNIIKLNQSGSYCLCLIDEMYKGTNSRERILASRGVLEFLNKSNSIVVVATHDIELAEKLDGKFTNIHFTDNIHDNILDFDYKIKEGLSNTTNAIKLLKYFNYPDEVFENI